jgi:HK97 family phage major capsid protein
MENILTFSADLTADTAKRVISGKIVPMGTGEIGSTSAGAVVFEKNSIQLPEDPKSIKLLNQHNTKEPLGKAQFFNEVDGEGIYASFKISSSTRGSDALITASEGLTSGLSVGVEVIKSSRKAGVMHVTAARLIEVSLVTEPAFKSAQITDVAASEEVVPEEVVVEETQPTESETAVENTPETVAAPVEAAAVEAARPTVTVTNVRERMAPLTSGQYLEHSIKAATGSDESRRIIRAADDDSSTNTGLTLAPHMNEFITNQVTSRAAIEAGSRGVLPASGLSFTIPRVTGNTAVADVNEGATTTETGMTSDYLTVNVNKFAGMQTVSWELLDRSAPLFYDEMIKNLTNAYANATDSAVIAALLAGGTAATATTTANAAGYQAFVATETAAAYKGTGQFARNIIGSTDTWAAFMGFADTTGRSLYTAALPQNASGAVAPTALTGSILGLNLYVDPNIGVSGLIDNSSYIVSPEAYTTYESPTTRLQVQVLGSGQVEIAVYGYLAVAIKNPLAIRKFNIA